MRAIVPRDEGSYSYAGMAYANPHAVTQIANGLSTTTYSYDQNGNLTQKTTDGVTTTYLWDYANRLIALGSGGGTTSELLRGGTIMDATLIAASPSTKNKERKRDPEMTSSKKGNQWYFGMKAHIGGRDNGQGARREGDGSPDPRGRYGRIRRQGLRK